jgi:uncharacterized membrane protein
MFVRAGVVVSVALVLASFAVGVYVYPQVLDRMPSHWDASGQVNGYMPKLLDLFLMPFGSLVLLGLFLLIPRVDPLRKNIASFRGYYDGFVALLAFYLLFIQCLMVASALGYSFNIVQLLVPAAGALFIYLGVLLGKAKMNWFIGIRTPWTLSDERVWTETHRIGGKAVILTGLVTLLGVVFPEYALVLMFLPLILVTIYLTYYSYSLYKRLEAG